jgi:hypothetical protein
MQLKRVSLYLAFPIGSKRIKTIQKIPLTQKTILLINTQVYVLVKTRKHSGWFEERPVVDTLLPHSLDMKIEILNIANPNLFLNCKNNNPSN